MVRKGRSGLPTGSASSEASARSAGNQAALTAGPLRRLVLVADLLKEPCSTRLREDLVGPAAHEVVTSFGAAEPLEVVVDEVDLVEVGRVLRHRRVDVRRQLVRIALLGGDHLRLGHESPLDELDGS